MAAGGVIIAVTHGGFLSAVHQELCGHRGPSIGNCCYGELLLEGTTRALASWNVSPPLDTDDGAAAGGTFGGGGFG